MDEIFTCTQFRQNLDDYVDGLLDQSEIERMDAHAKACPDCALTLSQTTRMLSMLASLDDSLAVPLDVQSAWRKGVRAEAKRMAAQRRGAGFVRVIGSIAAVFVFVFGLTLFTRIGAPTAPTRSVSVDNAAVTTEEYYYDEEDAPSLAGNGTMMMARDGAVSDDALALSTGESGAQTAARQAIVLREANLTLETTAFEQGQRTIEDLVAEYDGYLEASSASGKAIEAGQTEGRRATYTIRVPEESLDDLLTALEAVGTPTKRSTSAEDISDRYYDTQLRLTSYRAQIARLNELVTTAASLEDLLTLEEKITDTQYAIDDLEGSIRAWDSRARFSTIYVKLNEVAVRDQVQPTTEQLGGRIRNAFYDSINWLNDFWQDAAVVLAAIAPMLVIVIPLIILVWIIVAAVKRHRRRRG